MKKTPTLLEQAKKLNGNKKGQIIPTQEIAELLHAYYLGQVSLASVAEVLDLGRQNMYSKLSCITKDCVNWGYLEIRLKK